MYVGSRLVQHWQVPLEDKPGPVPAHSRGSLMADSPPWGARAREGLYSLKQHCSGRKCDTAAGALL